MILIITLNNTTTTCFSHLQADVQSHPLPKKKKNYLLTAMNCIGICGVCKYITIKHKGVNVNFQQLLLLKSSISTRDTEVNDMKKKLNYRIHGHLIPYH